MGLVTLYSTLSWVIDLPRVTDVASNALAYYILKSK